MDDAGPACPFRPECKVSPGNFAEFRRDLHAPEATKWKLGGHDHRPAFAAAQISKRELVIANVQISESGCQCRGRNAVIGGGIHDRQSLSLQVGAGVITSRVGAVLDIKRMHRLWFLSVV